MWRWKETHFQAQRCSSVLHSSPQLLAHSHTVSIINRVVLKDDVLCKLVCREREDHLPAVTSKLSIKNRILAFLSVCQGHIFLLHQMAMGI